MTFDGREKALSMLDEAIKSGLKDFEAVRYVRETYDNMMEASSVWCGTLVIDSMTRNKAVEMVSFLSKSCYLSNVRGMDKSSNVVKMVFIHINDDNTTNITTIWLSSKDFIRVFLNDIVDLNGEVNKK